MTVEKWDVLPFVIGYFLTLFTSVYSGQVYWTALWVAIGVTVLAMEYVSLKATRKTLSQQFKEFKERHPRKAFLLLLSYWLTLLGLTWHLLSPP